MLHGVGGVPNGVLYGTGLGYLSARPYCRVLSVSRPQSVVLYGTGLGYLSARPYCRVLSALQRIAAFQTGADTLGVYLKIENTSPPVRFTYANQGLYR